jgi:hypothetical protein
VARAPARRHRAGLPAGGHPGHRLPLLEGGNNDVGARRRDPVFTALIGAALGTGAGAVAGAAGKKSSDQQLATANKKLGDTHQQATVLNTKMAAVLGAVKTGMSSPAGQARFVVAAAPPGAAPAAAGAGGAPPAPGTPPPAGETQPPPTIEIADLDAITEALARILSTTSAPPVS